MKQIYLDTDTSLTELENNVNSIIEERNLKVVDIKLSIDVNKRESDSTFYVAMVIYEV